MARAVTRSLRKSSASDRESRVNNSGAGKLARGVVEPIAAVCLSQLLREQLGRIDETTNTTWAQRLIETLIKEALGGNLRAMQEILNRLEVGSGEYLKRQSLADAVDDRTAVKILEALCEGDVDIPGD